MRKKIDFRFPVSLIEQLKMISDWRGISMTAYVIIAVTEKLNEDFKMYMDVGGKWKRN